MLSLPTLDNHVDNPGQALYDRCKSLICKAIAPTAQKTGIHTNVGARLSLPALDNHVDKSAQALYDSGKSLI